MSMGGARGRRRCADVAAYRIVREGLTNVLRHSAACSARVLLARTDRDAEVRVQDDGPARGHGPAAGTPDRAQATGRGGYGLIGLRERAAGLGGSLSAATVPGGDFELRAVLPVGECADTPGP